MVGVYAQVAESLQKQAKTFNSLWFPQHPQVLIACNRFDGNRTVDSFMLECRKRCKIGKLLKKKILF